MNAHDVAVVGLGAMGSAAADSLARRGKRVIGFDRFSPPHTLGSSHGQTRIIREAYFEHPLYVPLVQRAYECWAALERDAGRPLLRVTGGLMIGAPDGVLVAGALKSAEVHHLAHQRLTAGEVRKRFPALNPEDHMAAVWEPRAGMLFPEACIGAQLERASRHGAELHADEPATGWRADGDGVEIATGRGRYRAARLVLAAGAWNGKLLEDLGVPLTVERNALYWFEPRAHRECFAPERLPIYIFEHERGRFFYGFPALEQGVKVAHHHEGEPVDPDRPRREVSAAEVEAMRGLLRRFLPDADGRLEASASCLYTNTPDEHFLVDVHPRHPQVVIASACSGHGFKFASVIGEAIADLVADGRSRHDLSLFRAARLGVR